MKVLILLFTASVSMTSAADTVNKWVDENGNVHYGDRKAAEPIEKTEELKIWETYDQQSYDEGIERHKDTKKFGDKLEKERIIEEEKRKAEENKPLKHPPPSGGIVILPPVISGEPYPVHPSRPGRPAQLPARKR